MSEGIDKLEAKMEVLRDLALHLQYFAFSSALRYIGGRVQGFQPSGITASWGTFIAGAGVRVACAQVRYDEETDSGVDSLFVAFSEPHNVMLEVVLKSRQVPFGGMVVLHGLASIQALTEEGAPTGHIFGANPHNQVMHGDYCDDCLGWIGRMDIGVLQRTSSAVRRYIDREMTRLELLADQLVEDALANANNVSIDPANILAGWILYDKLSNEYKECVKAAVHFSIRRARK